jgi:methylmalonyl-CoA epimerase
MKILGIEHLGIAVDSIDKAAPFWKHILKISHRSTEDVIDQGVVTDIYDTGQGKVELLEALGDNSPIAKFLDKRGPGIHHVCFEVEDINSAIKELKENNINVLSDGPTIGAEGYKVVFIHPKSTGGVLVELAEKP